MFFWASSTIQQQVVSKMSKFDDATGQNPKWH